MAVRRPLVLVSGVLQELPTADSLPGGGSAYKGVVRVLKTLPPASSYATFDTRPGGSTVPEAFEVMDFDATTVEYMDFLCQLDGYAGGGLTFTLAWAASSATSGTVKWDVGVRRLDAGGNDLDASKTYDYNSASGTANAAAGKLTYTDVTFSDGADMDSWADGELALVRVRRDTAVGSNMTGDAELLSLRGREQ